MDKKNHCWSLSSSPAFMVIFISIIILFYSASFIFLIYYGMGHLTTLYKESKSEYLAGDISYHLKAQFNNAVKVKEYIMNYILTIAPDDTDEIITEENGVFVMDHYNRLIVFLANMIGTGDFITSMRITDMTKNVTIFVGFGKLGTKISYVNFRQNENIISCNLLEGYILNSTMCGIYPLKYDHYKSKWFNKTVTTKKITWVAYTSNSVTRTISYTVPVFFKDENTIKFLVNVNYNNLMTNEYLQRIQINQSPFINGIIIYDMEGYIITTSFNDTVFSEETGIIQHALNDNHNNSYVKEVYEKIDLDNIITIDGNYVKYKRTSVGGIDAFITSVLIDKNEIDKSYNFTYMIISVLCPTVIITSIFMIFVIGVFICCCLSTFSKRLEAISKFELEDKPPRFLQCFFGEFMMLYRSLMIVTNKIKNVKPCIQPVYFENKFTDLMEEYSDEGKSEECQSLENSEMSSDIQSDQNSLLGNKRNIGIVIIHIDRKDIENNNNDDDDDDDDDNDPYIQDKFLKLSVLISKVCNENICEALKSSNNMERFSIGAFGVNYTITFNCNVRQQRRSIPRKTLISKLFVFCNELKNNLNDKKYDEIHKYLKISIFPIFREANVSKVGWDDFNQLTILMNDNEITRTLDYIHDINHSEVLFDDFGQESYMFDKNGQTKFGDFILSPHDIVFRPKKKWSVIYNVVLHKIKADEWMYELQSKDEVADDIKSNELFFDFRLDKFEGLKTYEGGNILIKEMSNVFNKHMNTINTFKELINLLHYERLIEQSKVIKKLKN